MVGERDQIIYFCCIFPKCHHPHSCICHLSCLLNVTKTMIYGVFAWRSLNCAGDGKTFMWPQHSPYHDLPSSVPFHYQSLQLNDLAHIFVLMTVMMMDEVTKNPGHCHNNESAWPFYVGITVTLNKLLWLLFHLGTIIFTLDFLVFRFMALNDILDLCCCHSTTTKGQVVLLWIYLHNNGNDELVHAN
jgi:hypothetical protein